MAGHLVQHRAVSGNGSAPSLAFLSNVGAGNLLAVGFSFFKTSTTDFTGISDTQSNSYTQIDTERVISGGRVRAYYAKNTNAGATTVNVTTTAAHPYGLVIEEWSGLDTSAPLDAGIGATGSGTAPDGGSVTATQDGVVWGVCTHIATGTVAIGEGTNFVLGDEDENTANQPVHTENRGDGGGLAAGSYSAPHTLGTSTSWSAISAAFKAAPSSESTLPSIGVVSPMQKQIVAGWL